MDPIPKVFPQSNETEPFLPASFSQLLTEMLLYCLNVHFGTRTVSKMQPWRQSCSQVAEKLILSPSTLQIPLYVVIFIVNGSFSVFSKKCSGCLLGIIKPTIFAFTNQKTQGQDCVYCFETQIFAYVSVKLHTLMKCWQ